MDHESGTDVAGRPWRSVSKLNHQTMPQKVQVAWLDMEFERPWLLTSHSASLPDDVVGYLSQGALLGSVDDRISVRACAVVR